MPIKPLRYSVCDSAGDLPFFVFDTYFLNHNAYTEFSNLLLDSKVHSPKSSKADWERAKALVEMEFGGVCQAVGHLYECHIRMEIICDALPKHLSPTHPLYEVMMQHCMGTDTLGYFGVDRSLLTQGGGFTPFTFGHVGAVHLLNTAFDADHYNNWDMELRLMVSESVNSRSVTF